MSQPPRQKSRASYCLYASLLELQKNAEGCRLCKRMNEKLPKPNLAQVNPLDRWWRQCSVICSEKSDRRELITREMIYSRIFIPCHSHQICAINELCGDRSIAKNLPKILTNSRLCLLLCNAVYKFQMPDLLWKVLPALFWCRPWREFHASVALFHFDRFCWSGATHDAIYIFCVSPQSFLVCEVCHSKRR